MDTVEDGELKDSVQMHDGKDWVAIIALVPGRKRNQYSDTWKDVLDPGRKLSCWFRVERKSRVVRDGRTAALLDYARSLWCKWFGSSV
jgi:hypothetical protein